MGSCSALVYAVCQRPQHGTGGCYALPDVRGPRHRETREELQKQHDGEDSPHLIYYSGLLPRPRLLNMVPMHHLLYRNNYCPCNDDEMERHSDVAVWLCCRNRDNTDNTRPYSVGQTFRRAGRVFHQQQDISFQRQCPGLLDLLQLPNNYCRSHPSV